MWSRDTVLAMDPSMEPVSLPNDVFLDKNLAVQVVVGTTCVLSMLGSFLIILSYFCFKELRSQGRQILVNLSLMDFGVGFANFTGIAVNFDQYYYNRSTGGLVEPSAQNMSYVDDLCQIQALVAMFCTYASVYWTATLAVYMYLLVFQNWQETNKYFYFIAYPFNYLLSAGICVWLWMTHRLGHAPYNSSGWCCLILVKKDHSVDLIATIIGYDLWIYLAIAICVTLYLAILLFLKFQVRHTKWVMPVRNLFFCFL